MHRMALNTNNTPQAYGCNPLYRKKASDILEVYHLEDKFILFMLITVIPIFLRVGNKLLLTEKLE